MHHHNIRHHWDAFRTKCISQTNSLPEVLWDEKLDHKPELSFIIPDHVPFFVGKTKESPRNPGFKKHPERNNINDFQQD